MMKINTKKNLKPLIFLILFLAIFAGGIFVFLNKDKLFSGEISKNETENAPKIDLEKPTETQITEGDRIKQEFLKEEISQNSNEKKDDVASKKAEIQITYANFQDGNLTARTILNGAEDSGKCSAKVISGEKIVAEKESGVQLMRNYHVCQGFDFENLPVNSGKIQISYNSEVTAESEF